MYATHLKQLISTHGLIDGRPRHAGRSTRKPASRGFSLTELLVVIAIIVLLVGLLLVALKQVQIKSRKTKTEAVMRQFANACASFQAEHGFYPYVIPDNVLSFHENNGGAPTISCTENALLALAGGYRVLSPADTNAASPANIEYANFNPPGVVTYNITGPNGTVWNLKVDPRKIGEGPIVNGKPYAAYFTPGPTDLAVASYPTASGADPTNTLPDLVDAWGNPIIFVKQSRSEGPLVNDVAPAPGSAVLPQFVLAGVKPYLNSSSLGEMAQNQVVGGGNTRGSMLSVGSVAQQNNMFAVVLAHPNFYKSATPLYGQPQGAFMLLSAGPDGVFFSVTDGPGTEALPLAAGSVDAKIINVGPKVINDFDDVRVFGGG